MERYARLFQLIVPFALAQDRADAALAELQKEFPQVSAENARSLFALAGESTRKTAVARLAPQPLSQAEAAAGMQKLRGGEPTLRTRIYNVMKDGKPRSPKEILAIIVTQGYKAGKNANLYVSQEMSKHPEEFERVERGVYRLAGPRSAKAEAPQTARKAAKRGNGRKVGKRKASRKKA